MGETIKAWATPDVSLFGIAGPTMVRAAIAGTISFDAIVVALGLERLFLWTYRRRLFTMVSQPHFVRFDLDGSDWSAASYVRKLATYLAYVPEANPLP